LPLTPTLSRGEREKTAAERVSNAAWQPEAL